MKNSLRTQMFLSITISLTIIILSMFFILFTSIRMQEIANRQFQTERYFQELQMGIEEIQEPLLTYLSSRSSQALATILIDSQKLRSFIPDKQTASFDPVELKKREVFALLDSYLVLMEQAIEEKRGRALTEYTQIYDTMVKLYSYINSEIEQISLIGFRKQLYSYQEYLTIARKLQLLNVLLILSASLFAFLLIYLMVDKTTGPMQRLSTMAQELSSGNFEVEDISANAVDEVNQVITAFNAMKRDIHQYIGELQRQKELEQEYMDEKVRNLKMEQLLKRMELYTMQAQMNPHFLFNTINTGVQLAILEEADKTAEFMENLAELFRHNIREKQFIIPLRNEIEGLRSYFVILQIRFPKSLELLLEVEEALLDTCQTPSMLLQPLVENAVIHAFKGKDGLGTIEVRIWKDDRFLFFSVKDNGIGMTQDKVQSLLKHASGDPQYHSKVMGLENVIQRLYFFYPEQEHVIDIISEPGSGTEILIQIDTEVVPCIKL